MDGTASASESRTGDEAELSREEQRQAHRSLRYHWERDGSLVIRVQLPAAGGALVIKALERALAVPLPACKPAPEEPAGGFPRERAPIWSVRQVDVLVVVAEVYSRTGGDRQQTVVHVDARTDRRLAAARGCEPGLSRGKTVGSPPAIAHRGLPQIRTCGFPASGSWTQGFAARA